MSSAFPGWTDVGGACAKIGKNFPCPLTLGEFPATIKMSQLGVLEDSLPFFRSQICDRRCLPRVPAEARRTAGSNAENRVCGGNFCCLID